LATGAQIDNLPTPATMTSLIDTTLLRPPRYAFHQRAKSFEAKGGTREQVCNIEADANGQPPERVYFDNFMPSCPPSLVANQASTRLLSSTIGAK
jgi:hypothetical protein